MKKTAVLLLMVFLSTMFACACSKRSDKGRDEQSESVQNIINDDSAGNGDDSTSIQTDKTPEINGDNELPLIPID